MKEPLLVEDRGVGSIAISLWLSLFLLSCSAVLHYSVRDGMRTARSTINSYKQRQAALWALHNARSEASVLRSRSPSANHISTQVAIPLQSQFLQLITLLPSSAANRMASWTTLYTEAKRQGCYLPTNTSRAEQHRWTLRCLRRSPNPVVFIEDNADIADIATKGPTHIAATGSLQVAISQHPTYDLFLVSAMNLKIDNTECTTNTLTPQARVYVYSATGSVTLPKNAAACLKSCTIQILAARELIIGARQMSQTTAVSSHCTSHLKERYWTKVKAAGRPFRSRLNAPK